MAPTDDRLTPDAETIEAGPERAHLDEPDPVDDLDFAESAVEDLGSPATDDDLPDDDLTDDSLPDDRTQTVLPGKVESWRKRSATGAVLTGIALGLQQVFGKEREEPAIVMTTSGDPPGDLPVEADVEHGRPRQSVVHIRPWLLDTGRDQAAKPPPPAGAAPDSEDEPHGGSPGAGD